MFIKNIIEKRRKKKDDAYLAKMQEKIEKASYEELQDMHVSFHNGIKTDEMLGKKVRKVMLDVDRLIEEEMESRGMTTLSDLEESIWFSQKGLR